ncbi:MAG: PIN domain-containing protein [Nitrococcus sp.]|nr:PIN domain-containing protein [Nitrococcus sp.]
MPPKALVLDANILIRAVLGHKVRGLLEQHWGAVQFFAPEVCFHDAQRYLPALFRKRALPPIPALEVLTAIARLVSSVDESVYLDYRAEAKERIRDRDIDDWPIVACALALNCPIWTQDTDFFGVGVPTWTTDRVHLFLEGA